MGDPRASDENIILCTDSYKVSHFKQYPPNTTAVYSYFESRGAKEGEGFPEICFFGLQYILKKFLVGQVVTQEKIDEAREVLTAHFGTPDLFYDEGWNYILKEHKGHLPIRIKAVPEGTVVPTKNVLITVENTDPKCYWLTNYVETLLVQVWYPMTVATNSRAQKELLGRYLKDTADSLDKLMFQLHDFGFRGSTTYESSGIGGLAHLVNFRGGDTMSALMFGRKYYHCPSAGFSIPAAEHSTITSWGAKNEKEAFQNMLKQYPTGPVACVSDSYDIWAACEKLWGESLKGLVESRKGGPLIVRPDSGDPATVVVKVLDILGSKFGTVTNGKGFKELPPCIRVIQGDGISYSSLIKILEAVKKAGWSTENLAFGSGGALLQKMCRDTQKCAFKCSYAIIDGKGVDVFKNPITDPGKASKKGRLTLQSNNGKLETVQQGKGSPQLDLLTTVFENGKLLKDYTLEEIRARAKVNL